MNFPIRLNHYLATKGLASRRLADKLIAQGLVKINGQTARLGSKVSASDHVELNEKVAKKIRQQRVYFAYFKPIGKTTESQGRLFHIGRLDKDSHGLLIMTNDGRITDKLLNPNFAHEKEYLVRVDKKLRPFFLRHLETGISIEGYQTRPAKVTKINDTNFRITLTEGKHHQIRRMCAAFNYAVRDLKRTRIMNISLGNLKPGQSREIKDAELEKFLQALSIK